MHTGVTWWKSATDGQRDTELTLDPALKEIWKEGMEWDRSLIRGNILTHGCWKFSGSRVSLG